MSAFPPPPPPPPSGKAPPPGTVEISRALFWGVAGRDVLVPAVGCRVYYLPEGHLDHSTGMPDLSQVLSKVGPDGIPWAIPCTVVSMKFFAKTGTGEVFTAIMLRPMSSSLPPAAVLGGTGEQWYDWKTDGWEVGKVVSFEKVLTPRDTHSGELLGISHEWGKSLLGEGMAAAPVADHPVAFRDASEKPFTLRHLFVAHPVPQHRLADGWGQLVDEKRLVPGDTIKLIKRAEWENPEDFTDLRIGICPAPMLNRLGGKEWNMKGPVQPDVVRRTITRLTAGNDDVVSYSPGRAEPFVVSMDAVRKASRLLWNEGTEVVQASPAGGRGVVRKSNIPAPQGWPFQKSSLYRSLLIEETEGAGAGQFRVCSPWTLAMAPHQQPTAGGPAAAAVPDDVGATALTLAPAAADVATDLTLAPAAALMPTGDAGASTSVPPPKRLRREEEGRQGG